MHQIENRKITVAIFRLMFKDEWIGNVICSYYYNSIREGFTNHLDIVIDIKNVFVKPQTMISETISKEIVCSDNSSQALKEIEFFLKGKFIGVDILLTKTSYEFNFVERKDEKIRLTLNEPNEIPYEIINLTTGKFMTLNDINAEDAINNAFENILN
jgi:hypothetical protein